MKKNVSTTSIDHYHQPDMQQMIRRHEDIVFEIMCDMYPGDGTLKEITTAFNMRMAIDIHDSSLCAPLNILKAKGRITDNGPKRPCKVNGITKKTWRLKLADDACFPRFSLHDLRATGITWLANAGVDQRIRQYLIGHHDGGPVINRYTKITADTEKQIRETVAVFDDIRASKENVTSIRTRRRTA